MDGKRRRNEGESRRTGGIERKQIVKGGIE